MLTDAPPLWPSFAHCSKISNISICAGRMTYDVGVMGNGALAGLVAITAGCSTIYPWGAVIVGGFAGALYVLGSWVSVKCHVSFSQVYTLKQ